MGLLDSFSQLIGGSGKETVPIELEHGETEMRRVIGSLRPGAITSVGGDLVLTSQRLVFTPLNTKDVAILLAWGLKKAGAPGPAVQAVDRVQDLVAGAAMTGIVSVTAGSDGSWNKPPTLIVEGSDGVRQEFGVLAKRRSRNGDPANRAVRDEMITAIRAVIQP